MNYSTAVPVISTTDVAATIAYWERTLGFEQQWTWGDPPVYAGIKAGGALLYITHDPHFASEVQERQLAPDIFLWVSGIEQVYQEHRERGAEILEELKERPWASASTWFASPTATTSKLRSPAKKPELAGCLAIFDGLPRFSLYLYR